MNTTIKLTDHPANGDPNAVCVSKGRGPGIYKTVRGFVACLPSGLAVDGFFSDKDAATIAQIAALDVLRTRRS